MAQILVIDDELFYRELVSDILTKAGHEVMKAKDGREALDALANRPDLDMILLDVVMPGMDGLVVLNKVRHKDPTIPVVMLSAHEDHRMVIQALRNGAFDYQRKPISAQELALAVQRAMGYRKLQLQQKNKLARLASLEDGAKRLSEMVVGDIPLEALAQEYELLDSMVKMVAELLECNRVSIMLLDPKDKVLQVAVSVGLSKSLIKQETRPAKTSVSSYVLTSGEALLVNDIALDKRVAKSEYSSQYKTSSFVIAPIKIGSRVVGTINANDKKDNTEFSEDDLLLLRTMSYHVSATLSHAIHSAAMERDRQRLKRLSEFQKVLIHYLEPEEMLRDLLKKCQEMMNVVCAAVFLKADFSEDLVLRVGYNGKTEMTRKISIPSGESVTGYAAKEGKIILLNAPDKDRRFVQDVEWPGKGVIRSMLVAPIRLSNTTIGVIRLLNKREESFTAADAQLLQDVADTLSIAIRNLKLYEQLNHSVEEIVAANRNLQTLNDELQLKNKELEVMQKMLAQGGAADERSA